MTPQYGPQTRIAQDLHAAKYRGKGESFPESQARFSHALADNSEHFRRLYSTLLDQRFMGAGRTQAAIGSPRITTAFNCYVSMGIEDS